MSEKKRVIVWFRQDLRLHDNEALTEAVRDGHQVVPVYVFDTRLFKGQTPFGFPKVGKFRAQFIIEAIEDLKNSLKGLGADLVIRVGKTEEEVFKIAKALHSNWVYCNRERTYEEVKIQDALEEKLWSIGQELRYHRGKMLYYTSDLPFPVAHTPDVFTQFRKEVERSVKVRKPLPSPKILVSGIPADLELGTLPKIEDFGHESIVPDPRIVLPFKGGETAALQRLHYYLWETNLAKTYFDTRNDMVGGDYSTKFSPWLAQGCISAKQIYWEIRKYEAERGENKSTYWIIFELLWRDFFRFMAKKYGNRIFQKGGTRGESDPKWRDDERLLSLWIEGKTGIPFIDANMIELKNTGFMSNRGRQNVASFLVKDLLVNWQMGAEYFESILIDYDVASNWGNWNYVAGVGSDPREDRYFNIMKQAERYDPNGDYVRLWLPELTSVPTEKVHAPDRMTFSEQSQVKVKIGANYPKPMINTKKWFR